MYHIKNDQRAIRSSQMLYDALARLTCSQPYNTITVTQLVNTANLGRTTFYRNFDEIEDILQMRCDQVFDELIDYIVTHRQGDPKQELGSLLRPMLRYFSANSGIIDLLLRAKRMDILQDSFRKRSQVLQAQAAQRMQITEAYLAYGIEMRINLMIAIVGHWVKTGKREAPDELADTLKALLHNMVTVDQLF